MKAAKESINVKKNNEDLRSQIFTLENQINKKILELKKLGNDALASKNIEGMFKTECELDFHGQIKMKFIDKVTEETYDFKEIIH